MKIYYKVNGGKCLTPCPYLNNKSIGSYFCEKCEHNIDKQILNSEIVKTGEGADASKVIRLFVNCGYDINEAIK